MDRQRRRIQAQIERACELGAADLHERVLALLGSQLDLYGACWHRTDPVSAVPVSSHRAGDPPGDLHQSLAFEYAREDVNRFAELADAPRPVGVLSLATRGRPRDSARYREMIEPAGAADELRAVFADDFGVWGCVTLFGRRRFTEDDASLVAACTPAIARALRGAWASDAPRGPDHAPVVIVLDGRDRLVAADARARERLRRLAGSDDALPGTLYVLAAQARVDRTATGFARDAAGEWLSLDATTLDDDPHGQIAVVIAPAPHESLLDTAFRARGLTARERQVAALAVRGRSTKEIAAELIVSPWTVQDHLKHIFEKCDVNSRSALPALATISAAG